VGSGGGGGGMIKMDLDGGGGKDWAHVGTDVGPTYT
jgi:hypothetical protein